MAQLTGNYVKTAHYYIQLPPSLNLSIKPYTPPEKELITVKEAASILGVSPRWTRQMIYRGTLNYKKEGRVKVYRKEVMDRKAEMERRRKGI